jgi:hypothetical protein
MTTLLPQDLLEIKFKTVDVCSLEEGHPRWMVGKVLDCSSDGRPLVQLADGQITELRSYMEWRRVERIKADRFHNTRPCL